jgi:hypothetical protein
MAAALPWPPSLSIVAPANPANPVNLVNPANPVNPVKQSLRQSPTSPPLLRKQQRLLFPVSLHPRPPCKPPSSFTTPP